MATLQCRHCGSDIDSDARRAQCRECRALFSFECAICGRNLRPPFPVFSDERHLTAGETPLPLCDDHFLRQCPDCETWFQNDENPGYFRCLACAEKAQNAPTHPEWSDAPAEAFSETETYPEMETSRGAPLVASSRAGTDPNTLILGAAGCAFLALMGWFLMGR